MFGQQFLAACLQAGESEPNDFNLLRLPSLSLGHRGLAAIHYVGTESMWIYGGEGEITVAWAMGSTRSLTSWSSLLPDLHIEVRKSQLLTIREHGGCAEATRWLPDMQNPESQGMS